MLGMKQKSVLPIMEVAEEDESMFLLNCFNFCTPLSHTTLHLHNHHWLFLLQAFNWAQLLRLVSGARSRERPDDDAEERQERENG